jgi:hypothetical protein
MDPLTAALIAGGINALQGKRGSDLLKSTVRDAALTYGIGQFAGGMGAAKDATKATEVARTVGTSAVPGGGDPSMFFKATQQPTSFLDKTKAGLETFTDVFRSGTGADRQIDKFKVGLGAGALGAGLYAAGAFDPQDPKDPRIPGANLIYYSQPEAFRTFGDQEIDPSKFPEKPYANMRSGGIAAIRTNQMQLNEIEEMKQRLQALQEAYDQEISQRSTNEPSDAEEQTSKFNQGDLVDALPSKTNKDENNEKNYKRTSGKMVVDSAGKGSENKDTMLAQLADGEFVTKSSAVRGAGIAMGADPNDKEQQREMGAKYFYDQMAKLDKLASMGRR